MPFDGRMAWHAPFRLIKRAARERGSRAAPSYWQPQLLHEDERSVAATPE
jgi:hypothetical protein